MTTINGTEIQLQDIMTTKNPIMQLHDLTGVQFKEAVTKIIVETINEEQLCDDAITEIVKEHISDESIMNEDEVNNKIESAIDDIDWSDKVSDTLDDVDFSGKINDALGDNDLFTVMQKDIQDLKLECNSLRDHNKKSLDMVSSLLELIKVINNR